MFGMSQPPQAPSDLRLPRGARSIQRLNGRTGERLAPLTLETIQPVLASTEGRVFERLYFSHDRAVAYARIQRAWNGPRHTLKLAASWRRRCGDLRWQRRRWVFVCP